jgi:hypothetical protein
LKPKVLEKNEIFGFGISVLRFVNTEPNSDLALSIRHQTLVPVFYFAEPHLVRNLHFHYFWNWDRGIAA